MWSMEIRRHAALWTFIIIWATAISGFCFAAAKNGDRRLESQGIEHHLDFIRLTAKGRRFIRAKSGDRFIVWGVNYDHDRFGKLIEDYWNDEWATIEEDFAEIKELGANTVRIHLQTARFMDSPDTPNQASLKKLTHLVKLSERTGLYLNITGLGGYNKEDVPKWYDSMNEAARWQVQALFWESVAKTCAGSPAIFCYDLMNEPILPGVGKKETDWLADDFAGKHFVQRITLDLGERTRKQVAKNWIDRLVAAIRKHDKHTLVTLGVIPWAHVWPQAKPIFYSKEVRENLDFVSVHFYPRKGEVNKAIEALAVYDVGKPLVVEEMFPLKCSVEELEVFVEGLQGIADGWMGFYWGKTIDEYARNTSSIADAITLNWLKYFRKKTPHVFGTRSPQPSAPADADKPRC